MDEIEEKIVMLNKVKDFDPSYHRINAHIYLSQSISKDHLIYNALTILLEHFDKKNQGEDEDDK